jgi:hypothetical protein
MSPRARDRDRPQYDNGTAFIDMLFNYLLAFAALFILALLMIRPPTHDAAVKVRAEFVLTMAWPDGAIDDIDMWLMLPDGHKVYFRNKDAGIATLDRDDLGAVNEFYTDADGARQLTMINREMITIRAIVPGRYVVSAHVYAAHATIQDPVSGKPWSPAPPLPYPVTLEVMKLNPRAVEVLRSKVQLTERGQEAVFAAFEVDAEGNVTGVEINPSQYQIVDMVPLFTGEDLLR